MFNQSLSKVTYAVNNDPHLLYCETCSEYYWSDETHQCIKIEGIAPNTYLCNGVTYFGENIAEVTAQAIAEQSKPMPASDWYVCDCGRTVDQWQACPDCIANCDKPGQSACLINGRLGWLPTDEQMKRYFAAELIKDVTIDIDDFMTGLPEVNYHSARNENWDNGVTV